MMGMRAMRVAAGVACCGAIAVAGLSLGDEADAQRAVTPVESATNNGPAEAFGPLRGESLYTGLLAGGDTEDWFHYWHVPLWDGPMAFRSACAARAELYSTVDDSLTPAALLAQFDIGPAGASHRYRTPEALVHRNLVRVVRTDGSAEPCGWHVDPQSSPGFVAEPTTPKVVLRVERKAGRAVAIAFSVRIHAPYNTPRSARIEIDGVVSRIIEAITPRSGVIKRRIALPAGHNGKIHIRVSAPATDRRPAVPAGSATVKVVTTPTAAPRPVVRRPSPPPRRPVVRKPKPPSTKVAAGVFYTGWGLRVRPGSIQIGESRCSFWLSGIRWSSWTSTTARGRAQLNQPRDGDSCPEMRKNRSITPTTIRLLRPRTCDGVRIFTRITWTTGGRIRAFDGNCPLPD